MQASRAPFYPNERRLAALERRQRRLEAVGATLLILLASALLGFTCAQDAKPEEVQARSFRLVDGTGKVRGEWTLREDGNPSFALLDADQRKRYEIVLKGDEQLFVRMRDRKDVARITHIVDGDHAHLLLTDRHQKPRVQMAVARSGAPSLVFIHKDGQMPAGLGIHANGEAWRKPVSTEKR